MCIIHCSGHREVGYLPGGGGGKGVCQWGCLPEWKVSAQGVSAWGVCVPKWVYIPPVDRQMPVKT